MADRIGILREDATYGEKQTLRLLCQNLPKEYVVYVETPIRKRREIRYPDFVILANYGVIVLEVKDWVQIKRADPSGAEIYTRKGESRWEKNPVSTAREMAIALSSMLESYSGQDEPVEKIPWGYAAVLVNQPTSAITRLRRVWGEEFVIGMADLENPDILLNRIKQTFTAKRMRPLTRRELDQVRAVIYPVVEIELENRPAVILDDQQERIVAEPIRPEPASTPKKDRRAERRLRQEQLLDSLQSSAEADTEKLPDEGEHLSRNVAIRLVRGFSGSGKTLVLVQRARFLAALYPDWKIGVLTFNKLIQQQFEQTFKGTPIKPLTFHSFCNQWLSVSDGSEVKLMDWIAEKQADYPIIKKLGRDMTAREIDWIRDMGITSREEYIAVERRGIGKDRRLLADERNAVFDVYEAYRAYLYQSNRWDWSELPLMTLQALEKNQVKGEDIYDAFLIDEAQDWAPVWFKVLNRLIHPEHGVIFLTDDPSQSIYRYFSWKEKSINVIGRTRWLRIPYRNTYEIYRAAYSMIANSPEIQSALSEEGVLIEPDLSSQKMRHGPLPLVRKCRNAADELSSVKNIVTTLLQEGFPEKQIAVLLRYRRSMEEIQKALQGSGVWINMIHGFKGLEAEAVIIPHLEDTFVRSEEDAGERRLLYMAMSRARSRLYLTYSGKLPSAYEVLRRQGLADFVE